MKEFHAIYMGRHAKVFGRNKDEARAWAANEMNVKSEFTSRIAVVEIHENGMVG
jgi:hypothetical protein